MPATLSRPLCSICSYRQPSPLQPRSVTHRHSSARQVRILQGVEYSQGNLSYLCPTCQLSHPAKVDYGLNICVSSSQLHNFHQPRDEGVLCPPDSSHVDWLTIPGATIADLAYAWWLDYSKEPRPMRVLLVAGLNDLVQGGNKDSLMGALGHFKEVVDRQNYYHPRAKNELTVATLLNPPKLVWFPNNGISPTGHLNRLDEMMDINSRIIRFNSNNGMMFSPRFHTYGVRTSRKRLNDGSTIPFKTHRWEQWRWSEPVGDMLHLSDQMRIRMGQAVVKFFDAEMERGGGAMPLLPNTRDMYYTLIGERLSISI